MFEGRSAGYAVGSVLIVAATALSLVGMASPGWLVFRVPRTSRNVTREGLFLECTGPQLPCQSVHLLHVKGFEMWSHVLLTMGVIALFVSTFFIVIFNSNNNNSNNNNNNDSNSNSNTNTNTNSNSNSYTPNTRIKVVEGFGIYGGFFLLIGIVNYVANNPRQLRSSYGYAFYLTVLSSLMATTGGALVALYNRKSHDHHTDDVEREEEEEEVEAGREKSARTRSSSI